jgi:hypothetical protein
MTSFSASADLLPTRLPVPDAVSMDAVVIPSDLS